MTGPRLRYASIVLLSALSTAGCGEGGEDPSDAAERTGRDARESRAAFRSLTRKINEETGARQMSPGELRRLLEEGERVLLLDVREPEEHAVSSLPGARLVPPDEVDELELPEDPAPEDVTIVTYCTAGHRSGLAAVELEERLGRAVFNLDGGIIAWFNEGGEVRDPAGRRVDEIHPFDDEWARFVRARRQGRDGRDDRDGTKALTDGKEPEP